MRRVIVVLFVSILSLAGCDGGSDRQKTAHPLDRGEQTESVVVDREIRDGETTVIRGSGSGDDRVVVKETQSFLATMVVQWIWWFAYYAIGIAIGVLVYRDAKARDRLAMNIRPIWWGLIPVFDAALGLLAYWVMNYSRLVKSSGQKSTDSPAATREDA